ncbi:DUF4376 domain-containing protein [Fusobacterium necrophorum subsp. funduliforme]|uniref:DUF4376 domain-containing protein n=1 Tax=Fusobacterium necrophorum TaxID=859 RepID=UPI00370E93B4
MLTIVHIYNEELKKIESLYVTTLEDFKSNPEKFYSNWKSNYYVTDVEIKYPKIDINGNIREKTREELIADGIEVSLNEGEIIQDGKIIVLQRPSILHKWSGVEWTVNLEDVKREKLEQLKIKRDEQCKENLEMDGSFFQVRNTEDRAKFDRIFMGVLAKVLKEDDTEEWRLADNTYKIFTYQELSKISKLYSDREREIFKKFKELDTKLKIADTVESIEKIKWE